VAGSLDVWEVIEVVRGSDPPVDPGAVAADLSVPERVVLIALDYYSRFPEEIDAWIADNEREAEQGRAAWVRRQAALS